VRSRIQDFPFGVEERLDPFDRHPELAGRRYLFIHLTGRGEFSYLFSYRSENEIIDAAAGSIPMGYTQIDILEWCDSIGPNPGHKPKSWQRRAAENLRRDRGAEGRAWLLVGDNSQTFGWTDSLHLAEGAAAVIATQRRIRIAIALLRASVSWH